jgi:hypothetical protein
MVHLRRLPLQHLILSNCDQLTPGGLACLLQEDGSNPLQYDALELRCKHIPAATMQCVNREQLRGRVYDQCPFRQQ